MKGLDTKSLIKSFGTSEAGPNPRCHTLMCLLSAHSSHIRKIVR